MKRLKFVKTGRTEIIVESSNLSFIPEEVEEKEGDEVDGRKDKEVPEKVEVEKKGDGDDSGNDEEVTEITEEEKKGYEDDGGNDKEEIEDYRVWDDIIASRYTFFFDSVQ